MWSSSKKEQHDSAGLYHSMGGTRVSEAHQKERGRARGHSHSYVKIEDTQRGNRVKGNTRRELFPRMHLNLGETVSGGDPSFQSARLLHFGLIVAKEKMQKKVACSWFRMVTWGKWGRERLVPQKLIYCFSSSAFTTSRNAWEIED